MRDLCFIWLPKR